MKKQKEVDFEKNYLSLTLRSALKFTYYFLGLIFVLNITYLPKTFEKNGIAGVFILLAYYLITSIVLAPILIVLNTILILITEKIMKLIYVVQPILGFVSFPAIMTVIPFLMILIIRKLIGNINISDYYFIYFTTWIASTVQYIWIISNIKNLNKEELNEKEIKFLKNTDGVDYF